MKKSEISKIKSKLKEWARSWISLDWDKSNIWEKRQNTVSAFFPWLPMIFYYTFKEESVLANIYQMKIVIASLALLAIIIKAKTPTKRYFLVVQLGLTLLISALILSRLLKPSDLNILFINYISLLLCMEITIIAMMFMFYETYPEILKIKAWIIYSSLISVLLISLGIIFLFSEVNTTNVFLVTAIYGVLIELTNPNTFLSKFYPYDELDSCVIKKNVEISFSIIKDMLVINYLSILIMIIYYKKIITYFNFFSDPNSKKGFDKVVLIASQKNLITGFFAFCLFVLVALILLIGKKNKLNEKFIEKENLFKKNKVRRRLLR